MFLTRSNVFHYLVERKFCDLEAGVSGPFAVRSRPRRNLNFHVTCGSREYLVKQAKVWDSESRATVESEAAFYRRREGYPYLASLIPRCYSFDPPNSILVFEFLSGYTDLYDLADRFSPEVGRLCGENIAAYHREMEMDSLALEFPEAGPSYLSLHEWTENTEELSSAQREFLRVLKRYPAFGQELDRLRAEWKPDALTHGDWKLDNCLLSEDGRHLRMVDWEFVAWGDSIGDVGALLQSYWNFWVRSPAEDPIESIRPALRAFLEAYAKARGREPVEFAARAIRFAGARMLQTVFETLDKAEEMTGPALRLLQGSLNILTRPDWAAEQLIGTPLRKTNASV